MKEKFYKFTEDDKLYLVRPEKGYRNTIEFYKDNSQIIINKINISRKGIKEISQKEYFNQIEKIKQQISNYLDTL